MNKFFNYLNAYICFLEETSTQIMQGCLNDEKKNLITQVTECLKEVSKKNKRNLMNRKKDFCENRNLKEFDVVTNKDFSKAEQISLVHLFLEICLGKKLNLLKLFDKKNSNKKIWQTISDLLDEWWITFEKIVVNNKKTELSLMIL